MKEMKIKVDGVEIELTKEQIEKINKSKSVTDRVKTMQDVYSELGIDKDLFEKSFMFKEDLDAAKVRLITKVFNEGWEPDWSISNENKYFPWFEPNNIGSFSDALFNTWSNRATSSSKLCFKSKELALIVPLKFKTEYENYILINK